MSKQRITRVEYIITLDGRDFNVRPLSLGKIKEVTSQLKDIDSIPDSADIEEVPGLLDKLVDVCFLILNRTNTGLTVDSVRDMVTVEDIQDIISIGMSGELSKGTQTEEA